MSAGAVVSIQIAPDWEAALADVEQVRAVPGKGLEGDRYFGQTGTGPRKTGPEREVTLIEIESVEALERDYGISLPLAETRRNIVTRGVALNHLVGRTFRVGEATLRGIRLAEPCAHLEELAQKKVRAGLVHRGGLRAQILSGGMIKKGDAVQEI